MSLSNVYPFKLTLRPQYFVQCTLDPTGFSSNVRYFPMISENVLKKSIILGSLPRHPYLSKYIISFAFDRTFHGLMAGFGKYGKEEA